MAAAAPLTASAIGSFLPPLRAAVGVATFRKRQSSSMGGGAPNEAPCMHCLPKAVALSVSAPQLVSSFGGCQRSASTGGSAYGMAKKLLMP
eukprot:SAG11_NODE_646_length_7961_cov_2.885907_12_plen_91_part_00